MSSDEQAIRKLIADWLEASRNGDHEKVLSLMADDVVFFIAGQPPMRGKSAFEQSQQAMGSMRIDAHGEVLEVKVLGDWAWCSTRLEVNITPRVGGVTQRNAGHTLSILRRRADRAWELYRDANMLAPVKPEHT